ncbi:MAG TPA: ribonucleoside-triphosphate reductase, adenosylcobalamin-dependent [Acidimicrobiaceae bacterium]|nr:ribonucleoside-triphosphate reductase, adenosylcobalamin-dependent [Acidimicrobiaceae bacterium]
MSSNDSFSSGAPAAEPVFYRTYSRMTDNGRETYEQVTDRTVAGLSELGKFNPDETDLVREMQEQRKVLPSGRWLWTGGTEWIAEPKNFSGSYNCTSTRVTDWRSLALMMDLAMMGSGTGAVLEDALIVNLPTIRNRIVLKEVLGVGSTSPENRREHTYVETRGNTVTIDVGDSRAGWVESYEAFLELASDNIFDHTRPVSVYVDCSRVRPAGERLKGFGGVSNPIKLPDLYQKLANVLNGAHKRQLSSVEICLLIDEAAQVVVAGNIRRSAGMRQFNSYDEEAEIAKDNLWQQDADGNWSIDPKRDALRMANHTRVFHGAPTYGVVKAAVTKQFYSGEGAIQYAPEAIARSNVDVLETETQRRNFLCAYERFGRADARRYLAEQIKEPITTEELDHRMDRYGLNPCGEILGADFHCNLSEIHLNRLDPHDWEELDRAFEAGALIAAALLHHRFQEPRYQQSREWDPIVGVSFTGFFDFCVHAFGAEWLQWWEAGRGDTVQGRQFRKLEADYLRRWKKVVQKTVWDYCDKHHLRRPNRFTTVQPAGTKSLLTGASSGWHPPKAARFIRRITFAKNDPVALACKDFGYSVIPAQSDKDEQGRLLDDPFDPRCTEWLVEIPTEVSWANIPGADEVDISKFSAAAQFDFYMNVQRHYTTHNTSATIEFREEEIEDVSRLIFESIDMQRGYISAALLARFDSLETFPRLPFEPIASKLEYFQLQAEVHQRRRSDDFNELLKKYDGDRLVEAGPAACDSDYCLKPSASAEAKPFSEESMFAPIS